MSAGSYDINGSMDQKIVTLFMHLMSPSCFLGKVGTNLSKSFAQWLQPHCHCVLGFAQLNKTVLGHGANIMLTDSDRARGSEREREIEREPLGCLACQIPQLHNSVRLDWAPAQPAFSTTMGGEAQERLVTPGERRNSLNPRAVIVRWMVALSRRCVILESQSTLCSNVFHML